MSTVHPGFKAVQKKIAAEGHSMASAGAILASASRNASPAAKKANPRLMKVDAEDKKDGGKDDAQENARGQLIRKKGSVPPWLQNAAKAKLKTMQPKGKKKPGGFQPGVKGVNPFANLTKK